MLRNVTVRVAVADVDVPRFARCVYEISLAENNRPGARMLRVRATDRDTHRNSSVRYAVGNDANGTVSIHHCSEENTILYYTGVTIVTRGFWQNIPPFLSGSFSSNPLIWAFTCSYTNFIAHLIQHKIQYAYWIFLNSGLDS